MGADGHTLWLDVRFWGWVIGLPPSVPFPTYIDITLVEIPKDNLMLFNDDPEDPDWRLPEKRVHVFVSGRVQGVSFRIYTRRHAQQIGVTGWVKNRWDGRVEAIFEGPEHAVNRAVAWCHDGSPDAHVDAVEVKSEPPTGEFRSFTIR